MATWSAQVESMLSPVFATFGADGTYKAPGEASVPCRVIIREIGELFPGELQAPVMIETVRIKIRLSEIDYIKPLRGGIFIANTISYVVDGPSELTNNGRVAITPVKSF